MNIGIHIDGVLMDDDTYRLDTITKYCYENNLPDLDNPYKYEIKCNWSNEIKEDYRQKYYFKQKINLKSVSLQMRQTKIYIW